jgi:type I restriction enzyme S subunit
MIWKEISIGEIGQVITGNTPPRKNPEFYGNAYKFIKPTDMDIGNRYTPLTEDFYSEIAYEKYIKSLIPPLSTCVVTIGSIGQKMTLTDSYSFINQAVNAVIPNTEKFDQFFIFYALKNILHKVKSADTGASSGRENVSKSNFMSLKLDVPTNIETQKKIGSVLSSFDDLIENNIKRIKLLEETAQNIYKEWFVNFRFPNYEHTEFDTESGLPVGWEKKTIDAFTEVITGKTPSTANSNFYGGNIPFVKTPDMHDAPYVLSTSIYLSNEGAESQNNKFLPKNSVMVSCIGTAGVVALASTNCQTNQQINSVRFDEEFKAFYFYGFARGLRTLLEGLGSNGATMVNVNKSKFEKIEIIVPDNETLKKHYGFVKVIFDQILILQEQNEKLKEARDILLPRLMNRTIEV